MLWKGRNSIAFESKEIELYRLRDRLLHYFGFILLEHDIIINEDFGNVIYILTILLIFYT